MPETKSAEFLVRLGAEAANKFVSSDAVSLNTTITKYAAMHKLSGEEVKRVCEHANRATFTKLFYAAPLDDKVVNFELADAAKITGEEHMNKAASLMAAPVFSGDMQADNYRRRHLEGVELPMEKAAHVESKPKPTERSNYTLVKRAHEILRGEQTLAYRAYEEAVDAFQKEAEEALRSNSLDEVLAALLTITKEGSADALETLQPVVRRLSERGLVKEGGLDQDAILDGDHPLMTSYESLLRAQDTLYERSMEVKEASYHVQQIAHG
jgi:hypothetical protein